VKLWSLVVNDYQTGTYIGHFEVEGSPAKLQIKIKMCSLCELVAAKRDVLNLKREVRLMNNLLGYIRKWSVETEKFGLVVSVTLKISPDPSPIVQLFSITFPAVDSLWNLRVTYLTSLSQVTDNGGSAYYHFDPYRQLHGDRS
jgi:hypothetical protein